MTPQTLADRVPTSVRRALPHRGGHWVHRRKDAVTTVVIALLIAASAYLISAWTSLGQLIDQALFDICSSAASVAHVPFLLTPYSVNSPLLWLMLFCVAVGLVLTTTRRAPAVGMLHDRRLRMIAVLVAYPAVATVVAEFFRDHVLIRPELHNWIADNQNSAPSGHSAAVTACAMVLIRATPPRFRALTATLAGVWVATIEYGLIAAGWHRPSDVIISTVLVAAFATLLPDPHPHAATLPRQWTLIVPLVIWMVPPIIVAVFFPAAVEVATAALVSLVVAISVTVSMIRSVRPVSEAPENREDDGELGG